MPRFIERILEWFLVKTKRLLIWPSAMFLNLEPGMDDPKNGETSEYLLLQGKWGAVGRCHMDEEVVWRARYGPDDDDPLYIRTEDFNLDEFPDIFAFGAHIMGQDISTFTLRQKALEAQVEYDKSRGFFNKLLRRSSNGDRVE